MTRIPPPAKKEWDVAGGFVFALGEAVFVGVSFFLCFMPMVFHGFLNMVLFVIFRFFMLLDSCFSFFHGFASGS